MTTATENLTTPDPETDQERTERIAATYGEHLVNTGGNDPLDLLHRLETEKNLLATNLPVAMLAISVSSQISMIKRLENAGLLPKPESKR